MYSEYCAINLKGDCGCTGIIIYHTLPHVSNSSTLAVRGLYVTKYYTGCHDWAQFYVAPYGWVFADLSFGGSAWREGDKSVGTITLVIWIFSVCQRTLKFKKNSCQRKNGFASIRIDNQRGGI